MKGLLISDTHGNNRKFLDIIQKHGQFDMVFHMGDAYGDEEFFKRNAGCPVEVVAGNNESYGSKLPKDIEIEVEGYKILITHGHNYSVNSGTERIRWAGRERGVDIVMFGHTHVPLIDREDGDVILVNPGSLTFPRQDGWQPTYIIMEIDDKGEIDFKLEYMDRGW